MIVFALADPAVEPIGPGVGSLAAVGVVLVVLMGAAWLMRRGAIGLPTLGKKRSSGFTIETAFSLGERRSLAIVSVEGKRLLLGLTPVQISLVAELPQQQQQQQFSAVLDRRAVSGDQK